MTIYSTLLGKKFEQLHPKLQYRYALPLDQTFYAEGKMQQIQTGSKLLFPLYLLASKLNFLFPESGENIPFTIANRCRINQEGEAEVSWERSFFFPESVRKFNAKMTLDLEKRLVKDFLGDVPLFYSDLLFDVTKEGFLMITSGTQKVVVGKKELTIPKIFKGRVFVLEGYDEVKDVYTIHVSIYNSLIGRIMRYAGEFTESVR
ncbi:hypothetical protein A1A1_07604 [Planococcus antarcticus DSM 14505]|uniref:DUF4166 domain-containing protein n=1 Tax=Planococcus antarcticus DSM 14505 TaxID=1185653 RepID=A0AA87IMV1_9BACL|nr:DUF4166 domain-containing protein [Planococcus antarcticus]EIM07027.1 hypothetical protein A1A1_07604 [Planococcus antarcticus DSM 14505]